jgi:hypothetical protein
LSSSTCITCKYFSKRPGSGSYFINKCSYWGIVSQNILPQSIVISSIGKRCPFFKQKILKKNKIETDVKKNNSDNNFDIII